MSNEQDSEQDYQKDYQKKLNIRRIQIQRKCNSISRVLEY
jgi:hypothetical protein